MDITKALEETGLSEGEIKVYIALVKLGSVPVNKIKEETNLHRTTIYDFLEKLINKGLVSYVIKNNVNYYQATKPIKLLDFVKEKEENIRGIIPEIEKLSQIKREEIRVEVLKGVEGFKTLLNDILRTGKELLAFGVEESLFQEKFPTLLEQYFKKEEKLGIKERVLTSEKTKFIFKRKSIKYRYVPDEFFSPTTTNIYGNKVVMIIWEPLTIVMIENSGLADSYKKHFEMLWKISKK